MVAGTKSEHYRAAAHSSSEILVSLRTAASAEAPLSPMRLPRRLQARGGGGRQCESQYHRVLTPKEYSRAAAHSRVVIFVSLRMAASAAAPSAPMLLSVRLPTRGGAKMVGE